MQDKNLIKIMERIEPDDEKIKIMERIKSDDKKIRIMERIESENESFAQYVKKEIEDKANNKNVCQEAYFGDWMALNNKSDVFVNNGQIDNIYQSRNEGIFMNTQDANCIITKFRDYNKLTNFKLKSITFVVEHYGEYQNQYYEFECVLSNGKTKIAKLTSNDLTNSQWIDKKLGGEFILCPQYGMSEETSYKYFREYISERFKNAKDKKIYKFIGWANINKKLVYLTDNEVIGLKERSDNICVKTGKRLIKDENINNINSAKLAYRLLDLANDKSKIIPLFLFLHISLLKTIFQLAGVEPQFILAIIGLTGSMKTSVSKEMFSIFNRDNIGDKISASFKDTITALEQKGYEYKDSPLIIDDFHPAASVKEKNQLNETFQFLLRTYGDCIAKSRSTKNLTRAIEFKPRGLAIITGEDINSIGESSSARLLIINVESSTYNKEVLSYFQDNKLIVPTYVYYFLEYVANNSHRIINYISTNFNRYRNKYSKKFKHNRYADMFSCFMLIRDIIADYYISLGICNNELFDFEEIIFKVIQEHQKRMSIQDPAIMFVIAINEFSNSGKYRILDKQDSSNYSNIIGYEDKDKYYLIPGTTLNAVKQYWKSQGSVFTMSKEGTNKALQLLDVIETEIEGGKTRRTIKVKINNKYSRYLVIKKDRMLKVIDQ